MVLIVFSLILGSTPALSQVVTTRNVDYRSEVDFEDGKDRLDIYMPGGAEAVPVIVFFHGGALRAGSKEAGSVVAERFVPSGVGVVSANYRLSPGVMHPAHVEDAAAAFAWVVKNIRGHGGDPDNVYVAGHSAGAYLATLLALDPGHLGRHGLELRSIRGTIPISPFLYVEETAADRPKDVWGEDPSDWLKASVTPHITAGKGPMLLIYADGDDEWRRNQNDKFGEAMRAVGNNVKVVEVSNRTHDTLRSAMNAEDDQIHGLVLRFLNR
jgi:acetyl esterase/lipase